jgi:hypothetical protein
VATWLSDDETSFTFFPFGIFGFLGRAYKHGAFILGPHAYTVVGISLLFFPLWLLIELACWSMEGGTDGFIMEVFWDLVHTGVTVFAAETVWDYTSSNGHTLHKSQEYYYQSRTLIYSVCA